MRKFFIWFAIGIIALAAYTYGAKAGRGRYRDIKATIDAVWNDPHVKKARKQAVKQGNKATQVAVKKAKKVGR